MAALAHPARKLADGKLVTCLIERETLTRLDERATACGLRGWTRSDEIRAALARYLGEPPDLRVVRTAGVRPRGDAGFDRSGWRTAWCL